MEQTLEQQVHARANDYSVLEDVYRRATDSELVRDPYGSVRRQTAEPVLSASVVIPAWNARPTLAQCLIALEQSSFNHRYPGRLEAIVVDDGSTDGTWELLESLQLGLRLQAAQQEHHSRAHAQNTAIALAGGDVIISCDADMILAPFSVEELVKRHQVLDRVMLIGFRGDIDPADPCLDPAALREMLPELLPPFRRDIRLTYHAGGWPESMCRDSDHLKRLGGGKQLIMADGGRWDLPAMVYGALFSLRRDLFDAMEGYDERFYGWGCEDTLVGVRALALSAMVIPVYSAAGLHIAHGDRSPRRWQEFAANRRVFQRVLQSPFEPGDGRVLQRARSRIRRHFERAPAAVTDDLNLERCYGAYDAEVADPDGLGKYLHSLGRYEEAAAAFAGVRGTAEQEAWAAFDRGKALRAAGAPEQAVCLLEEAAARLPAGPWPPIELALALAAQGEFTAARSRLEQARGLDPTNPTLAFLLNRPAAKHLERATHYSNQGDRDLAVRDCEAALLREPSNIASQVRYAAELTRAGRTEAAHKILAALAGRVASGDVGAGAACLELARLNLATGELGVAKARLEQARRLRPRDREVTTLLNQLHAEIASARPLPLARRIVEQCRQIPGWFDAEEAELLVAATLQAAAGRGEEPPLLVEIGSYCGRATLAMALALQGLGRYDARILAVHEPSLGPAPDGGPAPEALREHLAAHGAGDQVICCPDEESAPWTHASRLLLVDGRHDYGGVRDDVERYLPRLVPGGLLLFHDYADYFPDVQRCVDELLIDPAWQFVAQAASLIVLQRRPGTTTDAATGTAADTAPPEHTESLPPASDNLAAAPQQGRESSKYGPNTVWVYWDGPMPGYISLCCQTIRAHNDNVVLLDRASFEPLFQQDRDIDIDRLALNHRSDFVRAYLLKQYGGVYVDADCVLMRDLSPVIEAAQRYGFAGYREPQGYMSCNLMASAPDGAVINDHYRRVCAVLREGRPLQWLDLASIPMDQAVATHPGQVFLFPTTAIMPVSWSDSEWFCVRRGDDEHKRYFDPSALCYMLSNNTMMGRDHTRILRYMPESHVLHERYFISFLFRRSLGRPVQATYAVPGHLGGHEDKTQFDEGAFDYLATRFHIRNMVDIGSGPGGMIYYALAKDIKAVGVDGDPTIARDSPVIIEHDYTRKPLYLGEFDLGWSVEFLEHVEERYIANYMETFKGCKHVFVTAAAPGQPGEHHVNCQESEYWIAKFTQAGFTLDRESTEGVRAHSTMWSRFTERTGMVFSRNA